MKQKDKPDRVGIVATVAMGIKNKTPKQILRFLLASMLTGAIGLGSFWLLSKIDYFDDLINKGREIWLITAEAISVLFSCVCNYLLNKSFTFKNIGKKHGMLLYILYYVVTTPLAGLMIVFLVNKGMQPVYAKMIKMVLNAVCDFLYCKYFVFAASKDAKPQNMAGQKIDTVSTTSTDVDTDKTDNQKVQEDNHD